MELNLPFSMVSQQVNRAKDSIHKTSFPQVYSGQSIEGKLVSGPKEKMLTFPMNCLSLTKMLVGKDVWDGSSKFLKMKK